MLEILNILNLPVEALDQSTKSICNFRSTSILQNASLFTAINCAHSHAPNMRPNIHHVVINFNYSKIIEFEIKLYCIF
jgi:hypothetical protein